MKKEGPVRVYLKQMRIKSWLKNLFVFCPVIFSREMFEREKFAWAIILTAAFCLVSSAVYVMNDIHDLEKDRKHTEKQNRPIASGQIPIAHAWVLMGCLMTAGLAMALWVNLPSFLLILAYVAINVLYTIWLKTKELIDCFCIAASFVLRVMVGGTIVEIGVSDWMFLTVISLSLFMAFGKRRGELESYGTGETREVLEAYEIRFLNGVIFMCAGLTMVFYSLWSISQKTNLIYTVPLVLFIVIRYLLLVFSGRAEADPTNLILSDKTLLIVSGICALMVLAMLYGTLGA